MKKIISIFMMIALFCATLMPTTASAYKLSGFEVKSEAAALYSLDTDEILYKKNADEKRFPASLTKIMTAVIVMENCGNLDTTVTVTQKEVDSLLGTELTIGDLKDGEKISIRVLLNILMVCSAADAAVVLCDYVQSTTGKNFIDLMNQKAKELKMTKTNYVNTTGLHDDNHYTSVNDLIKLCKYAISLPNFLDMCSQSTYTVPATNKHQKRIVVTTNYLINISTSMYYKYAKGIKTGFTTPAGRCVASTASKDGYNYLCIVMGGDNLTRTEFSDSILLYEWAFNNFEYRTVAETDTMVGEMEVELASDTDHIQLYPEKNVSVIVPKDIDNSSIIPEIVLKKNSVWAPVEKGQIMGYARIICAGEEVAQVNLIAKETVKRSTFLYIAEIFKMIVASTWFKIIACCLLIILLALIVTNIIHNKRKRKQVRKVKKIRKL